MAYLTEQLVSRHTGSTLSEFMLEMCFARTDTSDSGVNDRLVKLRPLVDQTCFEFDEASYLGVVNLLLQHTPDAVVNLVKVR